MAAAFWSSWSAVVGEALGRDPRTHHARDEEHGADELGSEAADEPRYWPGALTGAPVLPAGRLSATRPRPSQVGCWSRLCRHAEPGDQVLYRASIESRTSRTNSSGWPAGSQLPVLVVLAWEDRARVQPMVTMMSAEPRSSSVHRLGCRVEMSMPTSAMASTAAGSRSPGFEPRTSPRRHRRRGGATIRLPSAIGRRCARRTAPRVWGSSPAPVGSSGLRGIAVMRLSSSARARRRMPGHGRRRPDPIDQCSHRAGSAELHDRDRHDHVRPGVGRLQRPRPGPVMSMPACLAAATRLGGPATQDGSRAVGRLPVRPAAAANWERASCARR